VNSVRRLALLVEYDGASFHGFQAQPQEPTVQVELERALAQMTGETLRVEAASRTDAGVHAEGQVVAFRTGSRLEPRVFVAGLNHYLPADIAVKAAQEAPPGFRVRRACSREYRYQIVTRPGRSPLWRGRAWRIGRPLDVVAMQNAADTLCGEHDLASFTNTEGARLKTGRRVLRADWRQRDELLCFHMEADAFLPQQVRRTVGALVQVGLGRSTHGHFAWLLAAAKPNSAGPAAPPWGLYLKRVNYPPGTLDELVPAGHRDRCKREP